MYLGARNIDKVRREARRSGQCAERILPALAQCSDLSRITGQVRVLSVPGSTNARIRNTPLVEYIALGQYLVRSAVSPHDAVVAAELEGYGGWAPMQTLWVRQL